MITVILDVSIGHRLKEAPCSEVVREILLRHLTYLTCKLEHALATTDCIGIVELQAVLTQSLEQLGVKRGHLLCLMVVEVQVVVHTSLTVTGIEGLVVSILAHKE